MESGEDESVFSSLSTVLGSMLKNTFFSSAKGLSSFSSSNIFPVARQVSRCRVARRSNIFLLGFVCISDIVQEVPLVGYDVY